MLNALVMGHECQREGDETEIVFAGTGTRWPGELSQLGHPGNELYESVRTLIKGASRSCAVRNQAVESLQAAGIELLQDNAVPGTEGVVSLRRYYAEGWKVAMF